MPLDWSPFTAFVHRHQRFALTTHVRPDADGLGSLQALAEALESLGKRVERVIPSSMPPVYDFLDPDRRIIVFTPPGESLRQCDGFIVLDTGTWNQLAGVGPFIRTFAGEKVVIDHHGTQDDLGATRLVDVSAEATGRLAYDAICALDVNVTSTMATNLFVALATDTGWFRHPNTHGSTFALAARLVDLGAAPTPNYEALYERSSLPQMKLRGVVLERMTTRAADRVAYSEVFLSDFAATGAIPADTENLVNYPRSIDGVEIGLLFI
jgi:phosphoesterase RecJ-like protein